MRKPLILILGILAAAHCSQNINVDNDIIFDEGPRHDGTVQWYSKLLSRVKRGLFDFFADSKEDSTEAATEGTSILSTTTSQPTTSARETRSPDDEEFNVITGGLTPDDEDGRLEDSSGSGEVGSVIPGISEPDDPSKRTLYRMTLLVEEPWIPDYESKASEEFRKFAKEIQADIDQLLEDIPGEQTSDVIKAEKIENFFLLLTVDIESVGNSNSRQLEDTVRNQINTFSKIGKFTIKPERFTFNRFKECQDNEMLCTESVICIPLSSRCDGTPQCPNYEDEKGCDTTTEDRSNLPISSSGDLDIASASEKTLLELHHCRADDAVPKACSTNTSRVICSNQFCDGKQDCPQGEDEVNCPEKHACLTTEFSCDLSRCIQKESICDGKQDCADGTDEHNCKVCSPEDVRCRNGSCVSYMKKCDLIKDCPDGEDEEDCYCDSTQFRCDGKCLPLSVRCNRYADCEDRSDEANCPTTCTPNQWTCGDGGCIMLQMRCDMAKDCLDGSDEKNCSCLSDDWFRCKNGHCILQKYRCDGTVHCSDSSDETGCKEGCREDQFTCGDHRCIHKSQVCNNYTDCGDGSDERNCPKSSEIGPCHPSEFRCGDGSCIPSQNTCDGTNDCSDNSDEDICSFGECLPNEFRCKNGLCVSAGYVCDGLNDCTDGSDEQDCSNRACAPNDFRCGDNTCIRLEQKCDGRVDCYDGSDEEEKNCRPTCQDGEWQCNNGDCIPLSRRCDGTPDCSDSSDETNNDCPATSTTTTEPPYVTCRDWEFQCWTYRHCIPSDRQCDGRNDCPDGSDEVRCVPSSTLPPTTQLPPIFSCRSWEFRCRSSGRCIPKDYHCDNKIDCSDGSDEENCARIPLPKLKVYERDQIIKESREAVFQCRDEGDGRYKVKWTREGGLPLPPGSRSIEGRLEIPNVQREHSGTYYCEAVNVPPSTFGARVPAHLTVEQLVLPTRPFEQACGVDEATCYNRQCILKSQVCDGRYDCGDGSDESRCQNAHLCEPNEFRCNNRKCVLKTWRCDKDDDCGDNSDEVGCEIRRPGSQCFETEFECKSRNQCIPRSFQCDGTNDCQDGSDEIGCYPMAIVTNPVPQVSIPRGGTLVLTCTAVGVPIPDISWRRDWRHVPSKCTQSSINGTGTLTCPDFQREDCGAYTCEALTSVTYIISPRDTIACVDEPPQPQFCPPGTFLVAADGTNECVKCFCFGAATNCRSADLYVFQLPPPVDSFRIVNVYITPSRVDVRRQEESYLQPTLRRTSDGFSIQSNPQSYDYIYPYYALPERYHGNRLNSYGGYITYTVTAETRRGQRTEIPDIIITGNNRTLIYRHPQRIEDNYPTKIAARLLENANWYIITDSGEQFARREDIMMVLVGVENILLRTQYTDGQGVSTSISGITVDSAQYIDTGLGIATYVEQCSCPSGYTGLSCETCDANYFRTPPPPWLGECKKFAPPCPKGYYGDPSRSIPCEKCPCPLTTPPNQFSQECYLDVDMRPTCKNCPVGYAGRRCEYCQTGFIGNPTQPGGMCIPVQRDLCDPAGTLSSYDRGNSCECKANVIGSQCNHCAPHSFHLAPTNQYGCINCFCMGITKDCSSSRLYRDQIVSVFARDNQEFGLAPEDDIQNFVPTRIDQNSLAFDNFQQKVYYWILPRRFLGNQLASYGGYLTYTLRYVPTPGGLSSRNNAADVKLFSRSRVNLYYYHRNASVEPDREQTVVVPLLEQYWQREDGGTADREHFLMALAELEAIYIKATYTTTTQHASLQHVYLDTATSRNTGRSLALEVEDCRCPPGYKGLSCESCDAGYKKANEGVYLGLCERCECNGRSEECNPDTGECYNCRDRWAGPQCDVCPAGYKDLGGRCEPTEVCVCDARGVVRPDCPNGRCDCKVNVEGPYCDRCQPGTFNLSAENPFGCADCYCSDVSKTCQSSNLFYEQLPMQILDATTSNGFVLTDRSGRVVVRDDFILNPSRNEIGYLINQNQGEFFWSLPPQFTGDRITSYGGNLIFTRRFIFARYAYIDADYDVILNGNGKSIYWQNLEYPRSNHTDLVENVVVPLVEGQWRRTDPRTGHSFATRRDFLEILSQLSSILIRASAGPDTLQSYLSDVALDIAISQRSGRPAPGVEVCRCPDTYKGTSCQQCVERYYRAYDNTCKKCECNNHEESCSLGSDNEVHCVCQSGYYGKRCENRQEDFPSNGTIPGPTITVTIHDDEPTIQIKEVGSTVRYRCSGISRNQGQGQIRLRWSKSQGVLPYGRAYDDALGNLEIVDLKVSDSGTYICTASDGITTQTQAVVLHVGDIPSAPSIQISPSRVEAYEGEPVEITCNARGSPLPSLEWRRNDNGTFNRQIIIQNGVLRIPYVTKSDEGVYECIGRNAAGSMADTIQVYVNADSRPPPTPAVYINPPSASVQTGDAVTLECGGGYAPDTIYEWRREDGRQYSAQKEGSRLVFTRVSPEDTGIYLCVIRSRSTGREIGRAQASITITSIIGPAIPYPSVKPEQQIVGQGLMAEFTCNVPYDSYSGQTNIRWYKANGEISPRAEYLNNGRTLRIRQLAFDDRGIYVCYSVYRGRSYNTSAILEVERREPPRIELYPSDRRQILSVGNSLLLQCQVRGIPTPVIRWSREDNSELPSNIIPSASGTLRFNQVRLGDAGNYVCTAENKAGRDLAVVTIEVQAPPEIKIFPADTLNLVAGENLDLTCEATGKPTPTVQWTRRDPSDQFLDSLDNEVTAQANYGRAEYQAFQVTSADEGVYWCIAQNEARRVVKFVQVYVDDFRTPGRQPTPTVEEDFWVATGGNTEITCELSTAGSGNLEKQWVRADRNPFPTGVFQREGVLYIRGATPSVQGEYICQLFDEQGRVRDKIGRFITVKALIKCLCYSGTPFQCSCTNITNCLSGVAITERVQCEIGGSAVLSASKLPEITLYPPRQVVRPGDDAEIRCTARGEQPIEIMWEAARPLPSSVTVSGGVLTFRGITESDAGRYICKARNIAGMQEAAADVIVNENVPLSRPRVTVIGDKTRATIQGSTITLQCSSDYPNQMGWTRSHGSLPSSSIIEGEILRIRNIQPYHAGRYICTVRTPSGSIGSDYIDLTVTRAVHVSLKIEPSIDIIRVGSTVDLRCTTDGIPSSSIEWSKLGEDSLDPNIQTISASVLRIQDVTTSNAGVYRCSAQTDSGTYTDDYTLNVQDNSLSDSSSASAEPSAAKTIELKVGDSADVSCTNDLEPPVSYSWLKQGGLPPLAHVEEEKLTLRHIASKDAGLYTCVATNGEVKMEIPTFVVVKGIIPKFSGQSYVKLKTLFDAYMQFDIEILFKPEEPNGLILYNGRQTSSTGGRDFVSFGLRNGYPEFRFDMGSGHATVVSKSPLPMGKWAKAKLNRNRKEGRLVINDEDPVIGTSQGRHQGLDLDLPLYLGAVPDFSEISKAAVFNTGFKGCISRLVIKNEEQNLTEAGALDWVGIHDCGTCSENSCTNSGACQEAPNTRGYVCLCPKGFSGENCDRTGESCYPGLCGDGDCESTQRGYICKCPLGLIGHNCEHRIKIRTPSFDDTSYIAYNAPRETGKIDITLKLNPSDSRDSLILYTAQNDFGTGNYLSISVKDRRIEFRIDTGSGSPMVLKSDTDIIPGAWMTVNAGRDTREAKLSIGHNMVRTTLTPGQRKELLLGTSLYVGGVDTSTGSVNPSVGVTNGFRGCISHIDISRMDLDILRSAKESSNIGECPSGNPCRENPCRNGATCIPEGSRYICQCTPDYSGFNCEKLKNDCEKYNPCGGRGDCVPLPTGHKCHCTKGYSGQNCTIRESLTTSFSVEGDGWVELSKDLVAGAGDETELELNIVTGAPEGILVWHGEGPTTAGGISDFFSVAIVNGHVEVVYELGSGLGRVVSDSRVNDGLPHRILVTRNANYATLNVDGRTTEGQSEGILSRLNANGNIYIGGVPDPRYMTNGRYLENFNGCIRNIRFQNSDVIDISNSLISTVNLRRCPVAEIK